MREITTNDTIHNFEKMNSVTKFDKTSQFDLYQCSKCGIKGKLRSLNGILEIDKRFSKLKVENCTGVTIPKRIQIIKCNAFGKRFENIVPNSIHQIIDAPTGYKNDASGVWVMGVGEPVKVLSTEFRAL